MSAEVQSLESVRSARLAADDVDARTSAAAAYVRRAEDAIALLGQTLSPNARDSIVRIAEAWLLLAEAELTGR